uniref:CCHC-type domain-containing protein n=1 Tax=Panagrolaimus sp. JU765 TaxID=591449 RepID=A0AC34QQ92_9BILA
MFEGGDNKSKRTRVFYPTQEIKRGSYESKWGFQRETHPEMQCKYCRNYGHMIKTCVKHIARNAEPTSSGPEMDVSRTEPEKQVQVNAVYELSGNSEQMGKFEEKSGPSSVPRLEDAYETVWGVQNVTHPNYECKYCHNFGHIVQTCVERIGRQSKKLKPRKNVLKNEPEELAEINEFREPSGDFEEKGNGEETLNKADPAALLMPRLEDAYETVWGVQNATHPGYECNYCHNFGHIGRTCVERIGRHGKKLKPRKNVLKNEAEQQAQFNEVHEPSGNFKQKAKLENADLVASVMPFSGYSKDARKNEPEELAEINEFREPSGDFEEKGNDEETLNKADPAALLMPRVPEEELAAFREERERRRAEVMAKSDPEKCIDNDSRLPEESRYRKPPRKVDEDDFSLSESDEDETNSQGSCKIPETTVDDFSTNKEVESECQDAERIMFKREPKEYEKCDTECSAMKDANIQNDDEIRDTASFGQNNNDENQKLTRLLKNKLHITEN